MHYVRYLKYVAIHKFYVYLACRAIGLGVWQALIHDLSKLSPTEFGAYARYYGRREAERPAQRPAELNAAVKHHITTNPHHSHYWHGVPIPERYVREMVADQIGTGVSLGMPDIDAWWLANNARMPLHPATRAIAEELLAQRHYLGGPWRHTWGWRLLKRKGAIGNNRLGPAE